MDYSKATGFICENIGVSGTTPCRVRECADGYEARMGFALMGATNMDEDGFKAADYDPFHEKFYDNYASGKGKTVEEAIESMKKDLKDMGDSLWAI